MSIIATRTIPNDVQPYWSCTVNGKKYTYRSGETVDVPDGVAAVIDAINEGKKRPEPEYVPTLPVITEADEGKVLKVVGGKWALVKDEGGGSYEFVINADATMDGTSFTFSNIDKTPAELEAVVAAKKTACLRINLEVGEGFYIPAYIPCTQIVQNSYFFCGVASIETDGAESSVNIADIAFNNVNGTWETRGSFVTLAVT